MKWLENIISISNGKSVGLCPDCGGNNTDYAHVIIDKYRKRGFLDMWCNDCGGRFQISCGDIPSSSHLMTSEEYETRKPHTNELREAL
ncbi:hypothetical protein AGMMS49975_30090 [Clostridia bacterium]|nr:hypothetical protein AGMMS49975_30090 [Clostridia bacterium]